MDDTLQHLRLRFNVVMLILLSLALIASVALIQHYRTVLETNLLNTQRSEASRLRINVDSVLSAMAGHVTRLQFVANDALAESREQNTHELPVELKPFYVNKQLAGYSLDDWHARDPKLKYGNIITDKNGFSAAERDEIAVMWRLFPTMRAMHASEPAVLWSYYQSMKFIALNTFPFEPASTEVERNGYTTFHDFIVGYTTPQRIAHIYAQFANSDAPDWRGAHIDGGGGGWIASVTTPVRYKNELWAVVAADVKLQFLTDDLQANVPPGLRALIVDDRGQLLADSRGIANQKGPPKLDDETAALIEQRQPDGQWQRRSGHYLVTQTLSAAPWHLVLLQTDSNERYVQWTPLIALALLLLIFIAGLIALSVWLRHFYVAPALRLAQQVMGETRVAEQPFPAAWRPSVRKLNEVWRERELLVTALQREQQELEARVAARTEALTLLNNEMATFSYAVSHDLRGPLRAIGGFAQALREEVGPQLAPEVQHHIERICTSVTRMGELIDGLLQLSKVGSGELHYQSVDLSAIASSIVQQLQEQEPERRAQCEIMPGITATGDERLLRAVLQNLLGNAWKYSSTKAQTLIRFSLDRHGDEMVYAVADNGAGFDMKYASRLFVPFQRLHSDAQFPGTGIGLATVQRIINRHGGRIWVKAEADVGATFYFTLPCRRGDKT